MQVNGFGRAEKHTRWMIKLHYINTHSHKYMHTHVQVTDFGSAKEGREAYGIDDEAVPWRWVSSEVYSQGKWSENSDVSLS